MHINQALSAISSPDIALIVSTIANDSSPKSDDLLSHYLTTAYKKFTHYNDLSESIPVEKPLHWEYLCTKTYWKAVVDIIKASIITSFNELPDVPIPQITHDGLEAACQVEAFAYKILKKAEMRGALR